MPRERELPHGKVCEVRKSREASPIRQGRRINNFKMRERLKRWGRKVRAGQRAGPRR